MQQAVILAAGEGKRLRPLTVLRPKAMLPVGNKPILQYVLEAVAANGIRDIVMVVGYHKEQVQDHFGSGKSMGMDIKYVEQRQQLGTAHALKQAREMMGDQFLVISGDKYVAPSTIAPLVKSSSNAMLATFQKNGAKYGVVVAEDGKVVKVVEKPGGAQESLISAGVYAFTRDVFDHIANDVEIPSVLTRMAEHGLSIQLLETRDAWMDMVYPWDMLALNETVLQHLHGGTGGMIEHGVTLRGTVEIGEGTVLRAGSYVMGPVVIGKSCDIGPNTSIFPSTSIGDNVVLSASCCVKNSIVGNDVFIGPFSFLENSVVARGSQLNGHFAAHSAETSVYCDGERHQITMGSVVGEHCQFEAGAVCLPGAMIGNRCRVSALKVLQHGIADGSIVV